MSRTTPGTISVIVPAYDVQRYLPACLDSLLAQTHRDLDVVCVNDGSTDRTPQIIARYAEADPRIRQVDLENGGLGHARNVGLEHTRGDFVAFVDGDDIVPDNAFALMARTLHDTGSDFATGRVLRTTGARSWPSGLHETSHPRVRLGTHITTTSSLVYDTTAWNKLFRRDFWDSRELRFPEGVLYEDIFPMMRAHVLAGAVDVVTDVVYHWRRRLDGSGSITQRRRELSNLEDRMTGLLDIREFLTAQAMPRLRDLHARKALELDVSLYLREFLGAGLAYQRRFAELVGRYVQAVPETVLSRLAPDLRIKYHLTAAGDVDALRGLLEYELDQGGALPSRRRGLAIRLDTGPASPAVPRRLADLRDSLPLRSGVDRVHWRGDTLVLEGFAFIESVPSWRFGAARRLVVADRRSGRSFVVWLTAREHPEATATRGRPGHSYRWSGFRAEIPASRLVPRDPERSARWGITVQVATPFARRGARLGPPQAGAARFCQPHRGAGDTLFTVHWNDEQWLTVQAAPCHAYLVDTAADDAHLTLTLTTRKATGQWPDALVLRDPARAEPIVTPLSVVRSGGDGRTGDRTRQVSANVPLHLLALEGDEAGRTSRRVSLRAGTGEIAVATDLPAELVTRGPCGTVEVRSGRRGQASVVVSRPTVRVERATWRGRCLVLTGAVTLVDGALPELRWSNRRGDQLVTVERRDGDRFESVVDLGSVPGPAGASPAASGRWSLRRQLPGGGTAPVPVAHGRQGDVETAVSSEVDARLSVDGRSLLSLTVYALPLSERGRFHQDRLRSVHYVADRRLDLRDAVLFESWRGKQYSDSPRALVEEALRRGDGRELLVAVQDSSIATPEGVRPVRRWSRDYYRALATARLVVSNDTMPTAFVKRPDQRYLQTWHGTPLKRIGFDMERIHFKNKDYLDELAVEVRKWDWLVSPNRYSTEILRTAFRFDGEILETGYPRNDIFSRPGAAAERERVRSWLGLSPDTTAVLWAPTWRDDQFDARGYSFPQVLDPAEVEKRLGPGYVVLFRGHHLVADSVGGMQSSGGTFVNVSGYPDVRELYLAADALVTDYSSTMFDFALTGRPILLFAWDLEDYRDVLRGFYLDIEAVAPGPLLRTGRELLAAVTSLSQVEAAYHDRYAAFRHRFCSLDDGAAAARVWDRVAEGHSPS